MKAARTAGQILGQMKVWKTQEYFVYFKFYKLHSWTERSVGSRSRFYQWFL